MSCRMLWTKVDCDSQNDCGVEQYEALHECPEHLDLPVKCRMLASFLFPLSFKISSALRLCSLYINQPQRERREAYC